MKVLIVEPGKHPRKADIEHTLESLQTLVDGYIEITYPWKDNVAMVCNDEGLIRQLPLNRLVAPGNPIFGTFFLCGFGEEDLTDLPDDMADKYMKKLYHLQMLIRTADGDCVLPLSEIEKNEKNSRMTAKAPPRIA